MPGTPFQPGKSGNPGGRPKAVNKVRELIAARGDDLVENLIRLATDPTQEAKDQIAATKELMDRWLGKATQLVDGDGEGGPIRLEVVWQTPDGS